MVVRIIVSMVICLLSICFSPAAKSAVLTADEMSTVAGGCQKWFCAVDGNCHVGVQCSALSNVGDACTMCGKTLVGVYYTVKHYKCTVYSGATNTGCTNGTDPAGCGQQRNGTCDAITTGPYCSLAGAVLTINCTEARRTCTLH